MGIAWARHGHGMASVNHTRPHCVNQKGKTHSKHLAARHDRGNVWSRHMHGMLCVSRPLLGCGLVKREQSWYNSWQAQDNCFFLLQNFQNCLLAPSSVLYNRHRNKAAGAWARTSYLMSSVRMSGTVPPSCSSQCVLRQIHSQIYRPKLCKNEVTLLVITGFFLFIS